MIPNRDWENWKHVCTVEEQENTAAKYRPVSAPRPGHADLAGCLKYNFHEARYILERSSARESTARVAAGALAIPWAASSKWSRTMYQWAWELTRIGMSAWMVCSRRPSCRCRR